MTGGTLDDPFGLYVVRSAYHRHLWRLGLAGKEQTKGLRSRLSKYGSVPRSRDVARNRTLDMRPWQEFWTIELCQWPVPPLHMAEHALYAAMASKFAFVDLSIFEVNSADAESRVREALADVRPRLSAIGEAQGNYLIGAEQFTPPVKT